MNDMRSRNHEPGPQIDKAKATASLPTFDALPEDPQARAAAKATMLETQIGLLEEALKGELKGDRSLEQLLDRMRLNLAAEREILSSEPEGAREKASWAETANDTPDESEALSERMEALGATIEQYEEGKTKLAAAIGEAASADERAQLEETLRIIASNLERTQAEFEELAAKMDDLIDQGPARQRVKESPHLAA